LDLRKHLLRITRFVLLFYVWSLICYGLDAVFFHVWTPGQDFVSLVLAGYYHEWFLPALILCYCAVPLLHGLLHADRSETRRGALLLASVVVLLAALSLVPGKAPRFSAALGAFPLSALLYLVYLLLGWYLSKRAPSGPVLALLGVLFLAALLVFAELNRRYAVGIGEAAGRYYGYLTPSAALGAVFFFCLCLRLEPALKQGGLLRTLSECCFGIYLIHPVFIDLLRSLRLDFARYSALWLLPLCYVCFLLLSFAAAWVLRRIPLLRRLVS
jgi:surface polysaccharide O-acyltransferase-like enzyme